MNPQLIMTGIPALDNKLRYLADNVANKVAKATLRAGSSKAASNIRRHIMPSIRPKTSDRGIGNRLINAAGDKSAVQGAKAGVGVGRAAKTLDLTHKLRRGRKGVGVSAANLHWFAIGTRDRYTGAKSRRNKKSSTVTYRKTGKPRIYTGRIDKARFGGFVALYGATAVLQTMTTKCTTELEKLAKQSVPGADVARSI